MAKIFKQIQQEYSSDNLCVRMATIFSSWRETLKQMQKERVLTCKHLLHMVY